MPDIEIDIISPALIEAETDPPGTIAAQSILDPAIVLEMVSQPAVVEVVLPDAISVELGFAYSAPGGGEDPAPESGSIIREDGWISQVVMDSKTITVVREDGYIKSVSDGTSTWTFVRDGDNYLVGWGVT